MWKAKRSLREYLVLSLCAGYALLSSGCAASPETAAPAALATFTPCEQPRPAWRNPDSYRPAMVPAWADDVDGVESPTFYRIEAYVDIAGQPPRVYAIQQTSYTNRSDVPMGALYFRLFPNKPSYGTALTFEEIAIGGQKVAVEYEVERTALRVVMPNTLRPGESVNVRMQYDVTIPVDNIRGYGTFNFQDGILLLSNFYPMVAVYEDGRWNLSLAPDYGDPVYAETSFYSVDLTVPRDLIVVTSGSTVSTHDNEDGTSTWSSLSGPMRDFMVVIGQRLESSSLAVGFVRVNSHYFPEHKSGGEEVLEYARDCLRAYQQTFGAYPFAEFDVVEAPVIAGGMEYPGLVMLGGSYYENGGEVFEFLTAHEVAHQWWYSVVGNDQVNAPWLDESLTNFSVVYYYEHTYGNARAELAFETFVTRSYDRMLADGRDAVVYQPVAAFSPDEYGPIVYGKGAMFFYELRELLGDDVFVQVLRSYYEDLKYGLAAPEDLMRVAEEVSQLDLDSLYAQWILEAD